MQIFSQNENISCVDFLQDKSTAVQYYVDTRDGQQNMLVPST